jgi:hypothetical protein
MSLGAACVLLAVTSLTACGSSTPSPDPSTGASTGASAVVVTTPAPTTQTTEPEAVGPSEEPTDPVPSESPTVAHQVDVFITYANWAPETASVEVGAFASTFAETGTCSLVLTRGSQSFSATADALPSASTMNCGLTVSGNSLEPGTWVAEVSYTSGATNGVSSTVEVTIP